MRGYDLRIEQARRRGYGSQSVIENKKEWQRCFLLLLIDVFDLSDVIYCLTTNGQDGKRIKLQKGDLGLEVSCDN